MQGIENLGSTCAINSLIQVISRNDILRNIILHSDFPENTIGEQLKEIIDLMYVKNNSIIPRKFLNTLYNIFKDIFYQGEQIDIGELWTFLSDKIADDIVIKDINNPDISNISNISNRYSSRYSMPQSILYDITIIKRRGYSGRLVLH